MLRMLLSKKMLEKGKRQKSPRKESKSNALFSSACSKLVAENPKAQ